MNNKRLVLAALSGSIVTASSPYVYGHLVEGPEAVFHNLSHAMTETQLFLVTAVVIALALTYFGRRAVRRMR